MVYGNEKMASNVMNIPFQSYNRLRQWYQKYPRDAAEKDFYERSLETFFGGMKRWMENMPATIRVFDFPMAHECSHRVECTDVQFELPLGEDASTQVYLMTLVTARFAMEEQSFASEIDVYDFDFGCRLEDLEQPFSHPTLIWDCASLTTEEVLKAVRAWSDKFWPDFQCELIYEEVEEPLFEPLEIEPQPNRATERCRVLLQCFPGQVESIQAWASQQGCQSIAVSQNHMVLLDGLPIAVLSSIKSNWPNLPFVAESYRLRL